VTAARQQRDGFGFGVAAYFTWGLFPLYWPLLKPANAIEILAQRMIWTLVVVLILVWRVRLWRSVRSVFADRGRLIKLSIGAVAISVNWGVYIYSVNSGQVIQASLGYFLTPLFTILVGVAVLGERLRTGEWIAVGIASTAIVVLAIDYGGLPWIALTLATSFTIYGLMKKRAAVGAIESLTVETTVLAIPALATLCVLAADGRLAFAHHGVGNTALIAGAGPVTAIPLLLFAAAARRLPLSKIGLIQYLTPIMQFLVGAFLDHERLSASRWAGFGLVWIALVVIGVDGLREQRRREISSTGRGADVPGGALSGGTLSGGTLSGGALSGGVLPDRAPPDDGQPVRSSTV
jgi:chloramphenicol-sensitive protein RarD